MAETPHVSTATGAEALVATLEDLGVAIAFGLPGVHNLAIWAALRDSPIRLVGVRHEQTAGYAADGLARLTGTLGVALVTTGPGAANTLAAVGEAQASHAAVLVVATDIPAALRRPGVVRGVLHETRDQAAMFAPVTKGTFVIDDPDEIAASVADAAALALAPPTGPVYVQIPTDLLVAPVTHGGCASHRVTVAPDAADPHALGAAASVTADDGEALAGAARLLAAARRPLVWVGSGAVAAQAGAAVAALAQRLGAPVLETYGARGLLPADHPCWVGLPPHLPAVGALWDDADVVLSIGSDLDGMSTQNWLAPQPPVLVAINIDAVDAAKNYRADWVLEGDARLVTGRLLDALRGSPGIGSTLPPLADLRASARAELDAEAPAAIALLDSLQAAVPADTPVVCDMCIPGYWVGALRHFSAPRRLAYPVGWGTLGYGFPAAIGTALAHGGPTLAVCGDGGFMFACGELATVAQERPELTVLIVDDGGYGMLRYDQRQAGATPYGVDLLTPDLVALAQAFGVRATAVDDPGEPLRAGLAVELETPGPGIVVLRAHLAPPPSTSPRWYRRAGV